MILPSTETALLNCSEVAQYSLWRFFAEKWVGYFCSFYVRHLVELVVDYAGCAYDMLHFCVPHREGVADEAPVAASGD